MLDFEVTSRVGMKAAVLAAAQPSYELARSNPVVIRWGTTRFTFPAGVHDTRADQIIRNIKGAVQ